LDPGAFQQAVKMLNETMQIVSNITKTRHDSAKASVANVR
jgi:hypothetical protein